MLKALENLYKELQNVEQNKEKILSLIDSARRENSSLSQTIDISHGQDNVNKYSILGIILAFTKKQIVNDLVDAVLSNKIHINTNVQMDANGTTYSALGYAARRGRTEVIENLLAKGAGINAVARWDQNGTNYTALGVAVLEGKADAMKTLLAKGADINAAARWDKNRTIYTALGVAVLEGKAEAIQTLLAKVADINAVARWDKNRTTYTALGVAVLHGQTEAIQTLLENGADINAEAMVDKNRTTYTALGVAVLEGKTDAMKTLLANGADYQQFDGKAICPATLQVEIDNIKKTKSVFDGTLLFPAEEINQNHLKHLCKQSGIPEHFSLERNPCFEIVSEFQSKESDLTVLLSKLLHRDNPSDFPAVSNLDFLLNPVLDDSKEKTTKYYQTKPYLRPDNFLNKDGFYEKLTILIRNEEIADNFFATTKDWILPQNQHLVLRKLKEEYFKTSPHIRKSFTQQHQDSLQQQKDFLKLQQELSTTTQQLTELREQISKQQEVVIIQQNPEIPEDDSKKRKGDNITNERHFATRLAPSRNAVRDEST